MTCIHAELKDQFEDGLDDLLNGLFMATQSGIENIKDAHNERKEKVKGTIQMGADIAKDTASVIADTAGMITSILTEDLKSKDIQSSLKNTQTEFGAAVKTVSKVVTSLANLMQTAVPDLPTIDTLKDPKSWPTAISDYSSKLKGALTDVSVTLESVFEGISAKYCTAGGYIPPVKVPTELKSMGLSLQVDFGKCVVEDFDYDKWTKGTYFFIATSVSPLLDKRKMKRKDFLSKIML